MVLAMEKLRFCVLAFSLLGFYVIAREEYMSAIGDPGMRRDSLRVAIEAWNQCNEVGEEVFGMGSPRMADCFDVDNSTSQGAVYIFSVLLYQIKFINSYFGLESISFYSSLRLCL
jgi:hypothetical protein